ncbi:MAG TPA: hypothetical protein GX392_08475 [Clostridiales bacterium]|nr:hypothetical protein [Clostridiales bacterium]
MAEYIWAIICWLCASVFIGIGIIYAIKSEKPIHFWVGSTVDKSELSNIPKYNKANAFMWIVYGLTFVIIGIIGFVINVTMAGLASNGYCMFIRHSDFDYHS